MTREDAIQLELLRTAPGEPGSGLTRYAAAVHFHNRGLLGTEALEVYRICSPLDAEDPCSLLSARGLAGTIHLPRTCGQKPDGGTKSWNP
jgi:hypothetical protein